MLSSARKVLGIPGLVRDAFQTPVMLARTAVVFEGAADLVVDGKQVELHRTYVMFDGEVIYVGQNQDNAQALVAVGGAVVQLKEEISIAISEWHVEGSRQIVLTPVDSGQASAWASLLRSAADVVPPAPLRIAQLRKQAVEAEMRTTDLHELVQRQAAKISQLKAQLARHHGRHAAPAPHDSEESDVCSHSHGGSPDSASSLGCTRLKAGSHFENILMLSDSYKVTHHLQYPPGTETIYSYFESRGGAFEETCFFGLQYLLKRYLCGSVVTREKIDQAETLCKAHFSSPTWGSDDRLFNRAGWEHILRSHDGRLPVLIKAVPEGTVVTTKNVLFTMENTDPKCFWLTNYLESLLVQVWYPTTVCTQSREQLKIIRKYLQDTGTGDVIEKGLDLFKLHDFGFRGVSSVESAALGSVAHLVNFRGTDTMVGLDLAKEFYMEDCAGFSIPASEHSTMTSWGREREADAMRNMLEKYPTGLVACVSDSYDVFQACTRHWGTELKAQIEARDGCLVVRPDSGELPAIVLLVLQKLESKFGSTRTSTNHMLLPPYIRIMQGDGIDINTLQEILQSMKENGWAADNLTFGSGGALLQKLHRDTQKIAFKCSHAVIKGEGVDVWKDPITDPGKQSKRGKMTLEYKEGSWQTITEGRGHVRDDRLVEIFRDGRLLVNDSLSAVRERSEGKIVPPAPSCITRASVGLCRGHFAGEQHDLVSELHATHSELRARLMHRDAQVTELQQEAVAARKRRDEHHERLAAEKEAQKEADFHAMRSQLQQTGEAYMASKREASRGAADLNAMECRVEQLTQQLEALSQEFVESQREAADQMAINREQADVDIDGLRAEVERHRAEAERFKAETRQHEAAKRDAEEFGLRLAEQLAQVPNLAEGVASSAAAPARDPGPAALLSEPAATGAAPRAEPVEPVALAVPVAAAALVPLEPAADFTEDTTEVTAALVPPEPAAVFREVTTEVTEAPAMAMATVAPAATPPPRGTSVQSERQSSFSPVHVIEPKVLRPEVPARSSWPAAAASVEQPPPRILSHRQAENVEIYVKATSEPLSPLSCKASVQLAESLQLAAGSPGHQAMVYSPGYAVASGLIPGHMPSAPAVASVVNGLLAPQVLGNGVPGILPQPVATAPPPFSTACLAASPSQFQAMPCLEPMVGAQLQDVARRRLQPMASNMMQADSRSFGSSAQAPSVVLGGSFQAPPGRPVSGSSLSGTFPSGWRLSMQQDFQLPQMPQPTIAPIPRDPFQPSGVHKARI